MAESKKAWIVLTLNTLAFTVCFAVWMMNGVLITYLVSNGIFDFSKVQIGWLIGIPVLTGSISRFPLGLLTDKYGGRVVFTVLMLLSALATFYLSFANSYDDFLLASLGFGLTGGSFAVGIAYTSIWFRKNQQGTALGIFGAGNAGAAFTSLGAPLLLTYLTDSGNVVENWRYFPQIYAFVLFVTAILFYLFSYSKKVENDQEKTMAQRLSPLKDMRVLRFGLYYFFVFGGFVALAQWLIPYYVNVYNLSVPMAGALAAIFSFPSGLIRAFGGWLSDKYGARKIMYWVFSSCLVASTLLIVPQMDIFTPGRGVQASQAGEVVLASEKKIIVRDKAGEQIYHLITKEGTLLSSDEEEMKIWPSKDYSQSPMVKVGDFVEKKQLLAKGTTHIYFQANVWIFTALVFVMGIMMGIGKAAVYKHIPEYFSDQVGVVGGVVGVIGGLGGFFCPIVFGYLLEMTGIWSTCWIFLSLLVFVSLLWMHQAVKKMMNAKVPDLMRRIERERS
jgi:MFS transporter, NNP family, nitrate/nitrite transporter